MLVVTDAFVVVCDGLVVGFTVVDFASEVVDLVVVLVVVLDGVGVVFGTLIVCDDEVVLSDEEDLVVDAEVAVFRVVSNEVVLELETVAMDDPINEADGAGPIELLESIEPTYALKL